MGLISSKDAVIKQIMELSIVGPLPLSEADIEEIMMNS